MSSKAELRRLQAKWYKKLAKSGFIDIEDTSKPDAPLKKYDSKHFNHINRPRRDTEVNISDNAYYDPSTFIAKQRYYELAEHFLNDYEFKTRREKLIWAEWIAGDSIRLIARRRGVENRPIGKIVRELERIMLARCKA